MMKQHHDLTVPPSLARVGRGAWRERATTLWLGWLGWSRWSCWLHNGASGAVLAVLLFGAAPAMAQTVLKMATTTSTDNAGLLPAILPAFEAASGIKVQVIAVGSGKALELGKQGDVDLVLVHARASEDQFVASGYGINRRDVMFNDFILLGPKADPAKVGGMREILPAMQKIKASGARFISRGDNSGTDQMEQSYWKQIGSKPQGEAYMSAGLGMGEVLGMAGQLDAYTLSDRATYAAYRAKTGLAVLVEGDARLLNHYGIIAVNPARFKDGGTPINHTGAMQLINWITSAAGQKQIADFKINGQTVFFPSARADKIVDKTVDKAADKAGGKQP
jgi:tungstate transport system substrate-binding protein